MKNKEFHFLTAVLLTVSLLTGCSLKEIKRQTEVLADTCMVKGEIHRITDKSGELAVAVLEKKEGRITKVS